MERKDFLAKLGMGVAAVCTGCAFASCGSKGSDPTPDNGGNTGGNTGGNNGGNSGGPLFTANLNSEITSVGQAKVSNGVILVRLAAGNAVSSFTAVQVACTHQGTSINYNAAQGKFICPNHGSQFSNSGAVLLGPAANALKQYKIAISGTTLSVSA